MCLAPDWTTFPFLIYKTFYSDTNHNKHAFPFSSQYLGSLWTIHVLTLPQPAKESYEATSLSTDPPICLAFVDTRSKITNRREFEKARMALGKGSCFFFWHQICGCSLVLPSSDGLRSRIKITHRINYLWTRSQLSFLFLFRKYKPITSYEQRCLYKKDFQEEYEEYIALKEKTEPISIKFTDLQSKRLQLPEKSTERQVRLSTSAFVVLVDMWLLICWVTIFWAWFTLFCRATPYTAEFQK